MTGPVLQYARWQLRDHLLGAGRVVALAAVLIGLLLWRIRLANPSVAEGGLAAMTGFLDSLGWPLVLLATTGIISTDRVEGYNRALFSAPVSPVAYYLQRWVLGGLVVATLPAALALALRAAFGSWVDPWPATAVLLLLYLLLGALVFCWSSFGRRDWAIGLSLYLGQGALTSAEAGGFALPAILYRINDLLPPFHLIGFGSPQRPGVELPAGAEWLHFVGYAVALLLAGCAVLRFRPMGSGVRG